MKYSVKLMLVSKVYFMFPKLAYTGPGGDHFPNTQIREPYINQAEKIVNNDYIVIKKN